MFNKRKGSDILKAIIFDMDGVVVDSESLHIRIEKELLEELGGKITPKEHMNFIGTTDQYMWSVLKEKFDLKPTVNEIITIKQKKFRNQIHNISLIPGFKDVLDILVQKKYLIALASSNNRSAINQILNHFNLEKHFQIVMSGDDVVHGKPNPTIFLKTAQRLNVSPMDCVVIEDSENGVRAAITAGMKAVGFNNENSFTQDLSKADLIINGYNEFNLDNINNLFK